MDLLAVKNLPFVAVAGAIGGCIIGNGIQDYKNQHKLLGVAKMALGASIAGAICGYAVYSNSIPNLEKCDMNFANSSHSSCPRIFGLVDQILGQGRLQSLASGENFPKLTGNMYIPESISCRSSKVLAVKTLFCDVAFSEKHFPLHGEIELKNTFKSIPGAELFQKLEVYVSYSQASKI